MEGAALRGSARGSAVPAARDFLGDFAAEHVIGVGRAREGDRQGEGVADQREHPRANTVLAACQTVTDGGTRSGNRLIASPRMPSRNRTIESRNDAVL